MKTTRAFTLIELLVVISIIATLASIVLAAIQPIRAQALDAKRKQEIHQIDLAIQQYIADKGYPPEWEGCRIQLSVPSSLPSGCLAVSTQGINDTSNIYDNGSHDGLTPWGRLVKEVSTYMPTVPVDPCTGSCTTSDGTPLGYTYMSPAYVQFISNGANTNYQLSAALQNGSSTSGSTGQSDGLPIITSFTASPTTIASRGSVTLSWTSTGATFCMIPIIATSAASPILYPPIFLPTYSHVQNPSASITYSLTCYKSINGKAIPSAVSSVNVIVN